MNTQDTTDGLFDLRGQVALLTGGGGVLLGAMARELGRRGLKVAVATRNEASGKPVVEDILAGGGEALWIPMDVTDRGSVEAAAAAVIDQWGAIDVLVNGAGGNRPEATASPDRSFFDLPDEALRGVVDLNLIGTLLPCQVVGRHMADRKRGCIVNISSMAGLRPLTRVVGYSAAKAGVDNVTRWLAVHFARTFDPAIRVNAIAPGFFETAQNRFLLRDEASGELTERGQQILDHTPAGRFGVPDDLLGALVWLASPSAAFVTGTVIPVDGGFSAYAGV